MKTILAILMLTVGFAFAAYGQKSKKVRTFKVEKILDLPAEKVWHVVGEDYGAIANSHPRILKSEYINGTLKAGEGAERICYFNDKGTQYVKEYIHQYDPANMTFINKMYQAGKFPLDPEYTQAIYKVEDLGNGKSRLTFDMQFRAKPAMMGAMAKGKFKKLIEDYFIAVEHHVRTGDNVTQDNFREIKKQYKS